MRFEEDLPDQQLSYAILSTLSEGDINSYQDFQLDVGDQELAGTLAYLIKSGWVERKSDGSFTLTDEGLEILFDWNDLLEEENKDQKSPSHKASRKLTVFIFGLIITTAVTLILKEIGRRRHERRFDPEKTKDILKELLKNEQHHQSVERVDTLCADTLKQGAADINKAIP